MAVEPSIRRRLPALAIETTKLCNSDCVVCPRESLNPEFLTTMPLDDFQHVARRVFEFFDVENLTIGGFGDVGVDKLLTERLAWLSSEFGGRARSILIDTNGASMSTAAIDRIVEHGLVTTFSWSLFADDRDTYVATNQRDQFAKAVARLEYALEAKQRFQSPVLIRLYTLLLEQNKDTFHRLIERWRGKVDVLEAWLPHNWSNKRSYRVNLFSSQPPPCSRVMDLDLVIRSNGDVTACCLDINHTLTYGNLLKDDFTAIFAPGTFYWTLRQEHETGTVPQQSICRNCDFLNNRSRDAQIYLEEKGTVKLDRVTGQPVDRILAENIQGAE